MGRLTCIQLLIGLALSPGCNGVKIVKGLNGNGWGDYGLRVFSEFDWELGPKQHVARYSKFDDDKHFFAFIACEESSTSAEVIRATLFSTANDQKNCWEDYSNPYGGAPILKNIQYVDRKTVQVVYTSDKLQFGEGWGQEVDTSKCPTPEVLRSNPAAFEPVGIAEWNSTHTFMNISCLEEMNLEPAEVNSTQGYIFMRKNDGTDGSRSIIFANKETGDTTVLDVVPPASSNKQERYSWHNGKNGKCFMEDSDIICHQNNWYKKTFMNYSHLALPTKVEWFDVHNLKAPAMLVLTTDCPDGVCRQLTIRKLEEGNKVSKKVEINSFSMYCKDPEQNLQMDTTDKADYSKVCFKFVCTGNDYRKRRVFQYRRQCILRDYFEKN